MPDQPEMSPATKELLKKVRMMVPPMLEKFHKGADLSHVICTPPAANVIKTYSPNLMVHPLMRETPSSVAPSKLASPVIAMLTHLHSLVIGPGLGRDEIMQATVAEVIAAARDKKLPLVLDADALWLVQQRPELIKGYKECVLTPNVVEFGRLAQSVGLDTHGDTGQAGCKALATALGGVMVVRKGAVDWISDGSAERTCVGEGEGGRKRSGGQGDTLTGSIATLLAWRGIYLEGAWDTEGNMGREETLMLAAWGGSAITRECSRLAFAKRGRSLQASDLTDEVPVAFETLIGEKEESKL
ncbi:MAG: hypothetical protein LQ348_007673 [Seirophora lacunosa]|nr:MAG: hypothetical protein LQ348_007673 [Seirophora lacunosa]